MQSRLHPGFRLEQVRNDVAMRQHGTLGQPRRPTGVLQKSNIVALDCNGTQARRGAKTQHFIEAQGVGQLKGRHHLFDMAHHQIHQSAFNQSKPIPHCRHHDMPNPCPHDHLLERAGEILQHDDGFGAAIV